MPPIFIRPVEITADERDYTLDVNGGGAVAQTVTVGTWGGVPAILKAIETTISAAAAPSSFTISMTSDFYVAIYYDAPAPNTAEIVFEQGLANLLGFGSAPTVTWTGGQTTQTATMVPSHLWMPAYERTNQEFFALQQGKVVSGVNAQSGAYAGIGTGTNRREMTFDFKWEPAANVADEFGTTQYVIDRNFETFIYEARAATQNSSDSQSPRGFYVYPDRTDAAPVADISANEGIEYSLTSSPDTHTFCALSAQGGNGVPTAALPAGRERYDVSLRAITADAPTWDGPA